MVSSAIPPDNPERAAARERGLRELHRAELLGEITRLRPTIAVTGTHGKTTTSSMLVHALRAVGMDPGYLVGGAVRSTGVERGLGRGGVARRRGRRVRPVAARAGARHRRADERRARPPHDLRLPARGRRDVPRVSRARRTGRGRVGPAGAAGSRARGCAARALRRRAGADARRLALRARRRRGRAHRAGRAQRGQRRRGADRGAARRRRPRGRGGGAARLPGRRPALRAARDDGRGRARGRRLRPPPDRGGGHAGRRPDARAAPGRGGLPAAPLLPHRAPGARVRRARWRPPTRWSCSTSTRRASGPRTSPASPACSWPRPPPTRPAAGPVAWLPGFEHALPYLRGRLGEGDLVLTLGAGDVDALGHALVAGV